MWTPQNITISILLPFLGLTACSSESNQITQKSNIIPTDTLIASSTTDQTTVDTTNYDEAFFPVDSLLPFKVLTTGTFHEDEVSATIDKEKWYGLFKDNSKYYLAETSIQTKRVHDAVLDETEDDKTGWEVSNSIADSNFILIGRLPFLVARDVEDKRLSKKFIYPDQTISFSFLGNQYKLYATGRKKKVQSDPEYYEVWNYKLFITATINGQEKTQLLVAQPDFDDKMIEILFAGDIDGDGIIDLIIDTSPHYNMTRPTLYLSKPSNELEIVKPVGSHVSVGC